MKISNFKGNLSLTRRPSFAKGGFFLYGFTIMEVLVSLVILGLVLVGILSVFVYSNRQSSFLGRRLKAIDYARQTLELLKNDVRQDIWDDVNGVLSVGLHTTVLPSGELKDTWGAIRFYSVESVGVEGRKVTVTVQWNEPE